MPVEFNQVPVEPVDPDVNVTVTVTIKRSELVKWERECHLGAQLAERIHNHIMYDPAGDVYTAALDA